MAIYDVNGNEISGGTTSTVKLPTAWPMSDNILIKHRAGNSASAFTTAKTNGYMATEGDVRFTSDKIPVMCHDSSMGGLTISTHTLAELQAETTVYTLEDWLADSKKYNMFCDIDFTKTYTTEQCGILVDYIVSAGMIGRVSIECGIDTSASSLVSYSEDLILNILGASTTSAIDGFSSMNSKCRNIICTIPHADATKEKVSYCHGKGYLAKIWTGTSSDTLAMVEGYIDMGADQVLTDNVKPSDL